MLKLIDGLTKATVGLVVRTPIALVADVVTLGGALSDRPRTYTSDALSDVVKNVEKACKD